MTTFEPRSAWTTTRASGDALPGTLLRGVAVHWPGTTQDRIGADRAAIISRLQHYYRFHTQDRGWRDIGYNIAIDQAGRVWMLRSTQWRGNLVGAHCASKANPDANREYVGVLFLLGDREPPSAAMIYAFVDWYRRIFLPGYPGRTDVRPHGEVSGAETACAGPYVKAALPQLRAQSAPQPSQEEDEMELTDIVRLKESDANVKYSSRTATVGSLLASISYYGLWARNLGLQNAAKLDAITAAVKAIPGVDVEALAAQLNRIDAQAVAEEVVDEMTERLAE